MNFDVEKYKQTALKILSPIKSATGNHSPMSGHRSNAGRGLKDYFLIYFLLNDLLGFKNSGRWEKVAWSFPIEYKGKTFFVEYRKLGLGVFVSDKDQDESEVEEIVNRINGAVKSARPFYDHLAETAVKSSKLNVENYNDELYERFHYLLGLYKKERRKAIRNKNRVITTTEETDFGTITTKKYVAFEYHQNANWLAISCIEAFFSWTEHLFIHLAIIAENMSDGENVSKLIDEEWRLKYKAAIKDTSVEANKFYEELLIVRQQLRNFVAHGAFGKDGNAFSFHSGTGAVPVLMTHKKQRNRFSLQGQLKFKEDEVIQLIEEFIKFLWQGSLKPAMYYTQECVLPTVLTLAADGTYENATKDMESMNEYSTSLIHYLDNAANMDW